METEVQEKLVQLMRQMKCLNSFKYNDETLTISNKRGITCHPFDSGPRWVFCDMNLEKSNFAVPMILLQ